MKLLGRASARLRRRAGSTGASLAAVCLALSCGLSPGIELPSANDGPSGDSSSDSSGLDLVAGAGGSGAGSGGVTGCEPLPLQTECRGAELWVGGLTSNCAFETQAVEVCVEGCSVQENGLAACNGQAGFGGQNGFGGLGGSAGATSSADDGSP